MAIIIHTKDQNLDWARWNLYPDQFVPEGEKGSDEWIKANMDYFAQVAYSQFIKSKDTFVHNYNLVKGILRVEDFFIEGDADKETRSFAETLIRDVELPAYVKHYPILNTPLNTMIGELSKRPDQSRVKAFDDDSKNEELQQKTQILQEFIIENAQAKIQAQQGGGKKLDDKQLQELTMEHVQEYITDYTSTAEKWANHVLSALKVELNLKEISEDCFRDLLICSREYWHVYENNSKLGLGVENLNPKNVWYLTLPDKKYVHKDAFAAGTVHVMELTEIIERFDLDKKEIDHLRDGVKELSLFSPRESNFENPTISGWDSIKYDTYSPLIVEERLKIESQLKENVDPMNDFLGLSSNVNTFGYKYIVIQAYFVSKKRVAKLTYIDETGQKQTVLVDEKYKKIPNQISIEWGYINQWYRGLKVGSDIYHVEPYKLLDYCPIIGVVHEIKNINEARSLVDMLKNYQTIYNICLNQLFKLLEKEVGNVYLTSIRHIPVPKDGDAGDAIDIWEEEARKRGIVFVDDSPENMKSPSNFNMFKNVDLTRTAEIQSRYELAMKMKIEAWELIGISKERAGSVAATQTATGTNTALSQSYAQTEPYFAQHEYVVNDVYQAILDVAQYVETKKPYSTLSYVNTEGEQAFIKVNSLDIKMRDLKVFVTSREEDKRSFEEMRALAQPMLQNGATPYEISVLYTTNSARQMRQVFKSLKDKMEAQQQQEMQLKDTEMKQQQAQFQYEQQQAQAKDQGDKEFEAEQNELDRINAKEIALISASAKEDSAKGAVPGAGNADILAANKLSLDSVNQERDYQLKREQIQQKMKENNDYIALELKKIQVEREKLQAQIAMKKADRAKQASTKKK